MSWQTTDTPFGRINLDLSDIPETPDRETSEEISDLRKQQLIIQNKVAEQKLANDEQESKQRNDYANKVYRLVKWWLIAIGLLVVACGSTHADTYFILSDKVIITILASTTATVIGLFAIVLRYLFTRKK